MDTAIIKLSKITKYYQTDKTKNYVLSDFSWTFNSNCFTVLAGPSGSGKSTLLNILGTLDNPNSGEYLFDNKVIDFNNKNELTTLRKNSFGFIFQSFNLIPVLNALENVELPLTLHPIIQEERRAMAEKALALVGLKDKSNSRPGELSGGQQQRVAIARAIARNPRIVFADEPTASLDKTNAILIIELMKELNENEGINFIIASHDEKVIKTGQDIICIGE